MKNKFWLIVTLIQVAAFILTAAALDRNNSPEAFHLGKFLLESLVVGLIFGAAVGYLNYQMYKKGL